MQALKTRGHDVAVSAFYGLQGGLLWADGIQVYPAGLDAYGNDVILPHAAHHFGGDPRDGLIVTLVDAWVLNAQQLTRVNFAPWTPVDHDPVPPAVLEVLEGSGGWPIAMSRFGERALQDAGLDPLYVPHSFDPTALCPWQDRGEARRRLGLPESAFVVGMVSANKGYPPRKGFQQAVAAFARFRERYDDAILYLHTEPHGQVHGLSLSALCAAHRIPDHAVRLTDPYYALHLGFPLEHMAATYNAFDVLLNPAWGEGFGVPILEAQACGTPVIVTDWTAMPELCAAGWKVAGEPFFTDQRSFMKIPYVDDIVWALDEAYESAHGLRDQAAAFAGQYAIEHVAEQFWVPVLRELEQRSQRFREAA